MANIVSPITHTNLRPQDTSSCTEPASWYRSHTETSYISQISNCDGSSFLEHEIIAPEELSLQHSSLNYNRSSANYTSSANVIISATSTGRENVVENVTSPDRDRVSLTVDRQCRTDTIIQEESQPNGYTSKVVNNYPNAVTSISPVPQTHGFISGSGPTSNPYGFSNNAAPISWKKPFPNTSALNHSFGRKNPEISYEGSTHQYLTQNEIFYDINSQSSYTFQEFSNVYLSRDGDDDDDDDLEFNSHVHASTAADAQKCANNDASLAFRGNALESTKPYRSFSSELNSPNLPLSEDTDLDFEFPLQLALGAADFDSFMFSVQNGNNTHPDKISNAAENIVAETENHRKDFRLTESCDNKYRHDSEATLLNSHSDKSKLITRSKEQRSLDINSEIPNDQRITVSPVNISSKPQESFFAAEKPQYSWLSRSPNLKPTVNTVNYNLITQDDLSKHPELTSQHDVIKPDDSISSTFGKQEYTNSSGNNEKLSIELGTHYHLKRSFNLTTHSAAAYQDLTANTFSVDQHVTTHKVAFDPHATVHTATFDQHITTHKVACNQDVTIHKVSVGDEEAIHYSPTTPVFGGHEYQHPGSCNFLNVGNFLNVTNENDNFEHADVKRCRNSHHLSPRTNTLDSHYLSPRTNTLDGHYLSPRTNTIDTQLYSGISEIREDCLPSDSYGRLHRNEYCNRFSGQGDSVAYDPGLWFSSDNTGGLGEPAYAPVEKDYCRQVHGQEIRKFGDQASELVFPEFNEQNFRDPPLSMHAKINSTTTATTNTVGNDSDRNSFHAQDPAHDHGAVLCELPQRESLKCSSNDSGQRALAAVITQTNFAAECLDSSLVKSAIDHIITNRPHAISKPMGRGTVNGPNRHGRSTQTLSGGMSEATAHGPEDVSCEKEGKRKKRKASKPSSEEVTTTTITLPPSVPSSSSPSTSLTSKTIPVSSLAAGVSMVTPSTNENNSSNVSSSSSKADKRRPSVLPPCRVCCSKASGLHYGVVTCEACNGFFRRSLKRGAIYMCSKDKKCDVVGKKRGECSHCRYKKCLTVGMSKSAVKTGRYSDKTRLAYAIETEAQNKTKMLLNTFSEVKGRSSQILNIHDLDLGESLFEYSLLEKQFKHLRQSSPYLSSAENEAKVAPLFECNLPEMPTTAFPEYLSKMGLSNMRSIILEQWLGQYLSFAKSVPGFNILSINDQTNLVRAAWLEVWLLEAFKEVNSITKGTARSPTIHQEIETVSGWKCLDLCYRLSTRLERLSISADELTLVQMLCLTDPLRYGLDNPEQVSSLQWLMSECLLRELEKNHPDDPHAFSEIHSLLADLKTACHDSQSLHNDYQLQYSPTPETPLLQEMLMSPAP